MTTRLDLAIQKSPAHEESIRLFASRDPSGNLKYLAWEVKVLESGQALAPEIADVVEMFHKAGRGSIRVRRGGKGPTLRSDLFSYRPSELASLRDTLLRLDRARTRKQRKRERLYRLEGEMEADILYKSPDLLVRHIKNKQASVHYGLGTRWCIAMKRESYFGDYESQNATFFFFERLVTKGDEFDKAAMMLSRTMNGSIRDADCFSALDEHIGVMDLANAYGVRVFEILRAAYECSEKFPGSVMAKVLGGRATAEDLVQTFEVLRKQKDVDQAKLLEAIVCNDAAPWSLLKEALRSVPFLERAANHLRRRRRRHRLGSPKILQRTIRAALAIHPNVPSDVRASLLRDLQKRHVLTDSVRIERDGRNGDGGVGVYYQMRGEHSVRRRRHRRRYRLAQMPMSELVRRQGMFERSAKRVKTAIRKKRILLAAAAKKALKKKTSKARRKS